MPPPIKPILMGFAVMNEDDGCRGCLAPRSTTVAWNCSMRRVAWLQDGRDHPTRLTTKRTQTMARKQPKAISSLRLESACASRAPYGAVKLETGAISAKPMSETKPIENGGI